MELRGDQPAAYDKIKFFVDGNTGGMFLLDGYAGTGKTFLMGEVLKYVIEETRMGVLVTAPTHKAVKVLRNHIKINSEKIEYATVHSALGLKEHIDGYGKQHFVADKGAPCKLAKFQFMVLDEASMLDDELYDKLQPFVKAGLKILFVGDSMQIPPVNKLDAAPFDKDIRAVHGIGHHKMEEIIRQARENPIIEHSFNIRDMIYRPTPVVNRKSVLNEHGSVTFVVRGEAEHFIEKKILPMYKSPEFKESSDHIKILGWTNKTVDKYNKIIRSYIYEQADLAKILPGERLIANEPLVVDKKIEIANNEEMEVISYTIEKMELVADFPSIEYYDALVRVSREWTPYTEHKIKILYEKSEEEVRGILQLLVKYAKSQIQGSFEARSAWIDFFSIKRTFLDVKYNYALTCHKSQGSTYHTAVVMEDDIERNRNVFEKNRILYTACTRPSQDLYVVH